MIETRGLTKLFKDKKRGKIRAVDRSALPVSPDRSMDYWVLTEPEKRPHSACWRQFWSRATELPWFAGTT